MTPTPADLDEARSAALDAFMKDANKSNPGAVRRMDGDESLDIGRIPTGALSLDLALGGGFPRGRIGELYGPESSGKTGLALAIAARAQELGGVVGFVDAEHALDRAYATNIGCDLSRMVINQPDSGEDGLDWAIKMCESGAFDLVIVDSVAALTPKAEIEGSMTDNHVGLQARMMGQGLRKITAVTSKHNTAVIFINQLREKVGQMYGNPETTPGGRALKFFSSVRIDVRSRSGDKIKSGDKIIGQTCRIKVVKNKTAPPFQTAEYDFYLDSGIDGIGSLLDAAEAVGAVERSGGTYTEAGGERIGFGKDNVKEILRADPELTARLTAAVTEAAKTPAAPSLVAA